MHPRSIVAASVWLGRGLGPALSPDHDELYASLEKKNLKFVSSFARGYLGSAQLDSLS